MPLRRYVERADVDDDIDIMLPACDFSHAAAWRRYRDRIRMAVDGQRHAMIIIIRWHIIRRHDGRRCAPIRRRHVTPRYYATRTDDVATLFYADAPLVTPACCDYLRC